MTVDEEGPPCSALDVATTRGANLAVLGLAFAVWALGVFVISPLFPNAGSLAFQRWEMISPTLITLFLYLRFIRREESKRREVGSHLAWLGTVAVVLFLGRQTWLGYQAMDDAPRGLLWDGYQLAALVLGTMTYWVCKAIANLFRA